MSHSEGHVSGTALKSQLYGAIRAVKYVGRTCQKLSISTTYIQIVWMNPQKGNTFQADNATQATRRLTKGVVT